MDHIAQFATSHWPLLLALIIILLLIFINERIEQKKRGKNLSPVGVIDQINNHQAVVFDLRDAEAFRAGHIINAIRISSTDLEQPKMEKYKSKPCILVCARGLESSTMSIKLRKHGFMHPMLLTGGFAAWQAAGLPTVKGK